MDLYKVSDVWQKCGRRKRRFAGRVLLFMHDKIKNSLGSVSGLVQWRLQQFSLWTWLQIIIDVCRVCYISCIVHMGRVYFHLWNKEKSTLCLVPFLWDATESCTSVRLFTVAWFLSMCNMCKIQQSIILARKLKQKAVNIRLNMLFVCFCWRIVKVFSYMTICVVHCVTPLYLKTAGIDSPQILRSIQLLLQPEDSYNYAEQAAVYSSIATALAWARWIFCTINLCARLWSIICLLGVHGWGRSYKCLIVFGNRDDSAPASGSIDMFPRCFVWKKHPVVPLDALQRNHRSASAPRESRW